MSKNYLLIISALVFIVVQSVAKPMIDCRVAIDNILDCNPYGFKLLKAKKVVYDKDRQKLIIEKTLPIPKRKRYVKVISVADMIEKYVKIEDSLRFKGSETKTFFRKDIASEPKPVCQITPSIEDKVLKNSYPPKLSIIYGKYSVAKGDALSKIAKKFGLKIKNILKLNKLKKKSTLRIGQKLKLPFEQKVIDAIVSARYQVETGDTLISIAKKFQLDPKILAQFNHIKRTTSLRAGKFIKLPLPYVVAKKKTEKKNKLKIVRGFGGKRKLRVTATAYSSHRGQTDKTPFLAAWNNHIRPGMKIIAVSRDMLTRYGMRNGTRVRIGGLPGYYRVRDKMNKRYTKRIDIYMGVNRRKALRWGRRSVVIYW